MGPQPQSLPFTQPWVDWKLNNADDIQAILNPLPE